MNKQRRLELLDVVSALDDAVARLGEIRDEEQDSYDNLTEGLQCSSRGDSMQEAIDIMEEWEASIIDIRNDVEEYATPKKNRR